MSRRGYNNSRSYYHPSTYVVRYLNVNGQERRETTSGETRTEAEEKFRKYFPRTKIISMELETEAKKEQDTRTPLQKRTEQLGDGPTGIGFQYMSGQLSVKDVVKYVNSSHWNEKTERDIANGAALAESEGYALKSRVQPIQGEVKLAGPVKQKQWDNSKAVSLFTKKKKLKDGTYEYPKPYTQPPRVKNFVHPTPPPLRKHPTVVKPTKGKTGRVLSKYDVTAVNKQKDRLKSEQATGSKQVRPTKGRIRADLHKKRQRFDIYNVSKHRHVKE